MFSSLIDVTFDPLITYLLSILMILPASSNIRTIICLFCSQVTSSVTDVWNGLGLVVTFILISFVLLCISFVVPWSLATNSNSRLKASGMAVLSVFAFLSSVHRGLLWC